jgi:hypothetical protein
LNTLGKMFEKMLSNRLQFEAAEHGVLHPNQFGGVCQNSTEDAGCVFTHVVQVGWRAKLKTSMVAFDLAQFFPSINHDVLLSILDKQGFMPEVVVFFRSYLVDRFTCHTWDNDLSPEFPSSVGVGQGSALSPILLALCLASLLKEFEHRVCVAVLISYVNDGTIIVQSDMWGKNLVKLKSAYKIMFELTHSLNTASWKDSTSPENTVTVTLTVTLAMPPTLHLAIPGLLLQSCSHIPGACQTLHKQGPHYCEGHAHSQQLCVWPAAQTQTNAILCLCPPHCYV